MGRLTVRRVGRLLVMALVVSTATVAFTGTSWAADGTHAAEENLFAAKINGARGGRGLRRLTVDLQLTRVARGWTDRMAASRKLSHNKRVASQVRGDWTRLGENVGYSSRSGSAPREFVNRLHEAFMNSPGHRANIMGDYNQVGVGVRIVADTMWVTVNFAKSPKVVSNATVTEARRVTGRVFAAAGTPGRRAAYAVVTSSKVAAHAMGGAALAGDAAPLLYTHSSNRWDRSPVLHPVTREAIDRVLGGRGLVYVVGGPGAVSDRAVQELVNDGYAVRRLGGGSVPATLARVAAETVRRHGDTRRVVITSRRDQGSGVAAAMWAARSGTPILMTGPRRLHRSVRRYLRTHRPARRWVVGSRRAVRVPVMRAARARRIAGRNDAQISVNVARRLWRRTAASHGDRWASTPGFGRSGWAFALAYAPWSATFDGPALPVGARSVPAPVRSYLGKLRYGGPVRGRVQRAGPVPRGVVKRVESLVGAR